MPYETFFNLPEAKRQKILDILLDEFANNDYRNASISRIVKRAGIAKGSFYQYFADKEDCYLYLLKLAMDEKMAFMSQMVPPDEDIDIIEYQRWMLRAGTGFEFSNQRLAKIGYKAMIDDVPLPEETLKIVRESTDEYFRQMLQRGIDAGTVREDIDLDTAVFVMNVIFSNMGQHLMQRFAIAPESLLASDTSAFEQAPIQQIMDQVITLIEHGLRK